MSNALDLDDEAPSPKPIEVDYTQSKGPVDLVAERGIIAACVIDSDFVTACRSVVPEDFSDLRHRLIFGHIRRVADSGRPVETHTVLESLRSARQLTAAGGMPYMLDVTGTVPTTALAQDHLQTVRSKAALRRMVEISAKAIQQADGANGDASELIERFREEVGKLSSSPSGERSATRHLRSPSAFLLPPDGDSSTLLGNRYLVRGDGAVLSGTSGMGKSAMSLQMAFTWALGRPFFGIKPNGPLRSLIAQSEDSDGDIAEMWISMSRTMGLSADQIAQIDANVKIVSERVYRGTALCGRCWSADEPVPECDHDWHFVNDSFDHAFGTERVVFDRCEICGATREAEAYEGPEG